jgi:hypothetical protein
MALALWVATASYGNAEDFVGLVNPANNPPSLRRDKLPLDVERLANLSRNLAAVARSMDTKTPTNHRCAAQLLALALALDPGNTQVRALISEFRKKRHEPDSGNRNRLRNLEEIREVITGLDFPEAGGSGRALVDYLADVLRYFDPALGDDAPSVAERGNWAGWVPELSFFEPKAVATSPPTQPEPKVAEESFRLSRAEVTTPMWNRSRTDPIEGWILSPGKLEMEADATGEFAQRPFSLIVHMQGEGVDTAALSSDLVSLLKKQHGSLPKYGTIAIGSSFLTLSAPLQNRSYISAAAAVLASSAITGRVPDATIIGTVDANGSFNLPPRFWDQLRSLGPGNGGRLVLPTAAATSDLPALLAMEKPQFFFDYEVVLAANFQELLEFSAKEPAESFAKPSLLFQQVREKLGSQPIGQYVANPYIRRRFADIYQLAPYHASVKMLGIQGAGNRPIHVARSIFATELRHALEPLGWLLNRTDPVLDPQEYRQIDSSYESCVQSIEQLTRYAERAEDDLVAKTKELLAQVRNLERATRTRGEDYEIQIALNTAHVSLIHTYTAYAPFLETACDDKSLSSAR